MPETKIDWTEVGCRCPARIATDAASESNRTHTVHIEDMEASVDRAEPGTSIEMIRHDDGGLLLYDDGETIYRRVVEQPETLTHAFQQAVAETIAHYQTLDGYGEEIEVSYSRKRDAPVDFEVPDDVRFDDMSE